jgi:hypothetical protein
MGPWYCLVAAKLEPVPSVGLERHSAEVPLLEAGRTDRSRGGEEGHYLVNCKNQSLNSGINDELILRKVWRNYGISMDFTRLWGVTLVVTAARTSTSSSKQYSKCIS